MTKAYHTPRFIVYGLIDPRSGQLRYIGKSCSGVSRPKWHWCKSALKENTRKATWIKSLLSLNLTPDIEVLEVSTRNDLSEAEVFWIQYFKSIGANLTNMTSGGDGCPGRIYTTETKRKMSLAQRGRVNSQESKRKMSLAWGITPEKEKQIEALFKQGLSYRDIANEVGVSKRGAILIAKRLKLQRNPQWYSAQAKEKQVEAVRLRNWGLKLRQIAECLGISISRASVLCRHNLNAEPSTEF